MELSLHLFQSGASAAMLWKVRIMTTAWGFTLCSCFQLLLLPICHIYNAEKRWNRSYTAEGRVLATENEAFCTVVAYYLGDSMLEGKLVPQVSGWVEKWQPQLHEVPSARHFKKTVMSIVTAAALESKEILQSGWQVEPILSPAEENVCCHDN